jgi:hypothetical protein
VPAAFDHFAREASGGDQSRGVLVVRERPAFEIDAPAAELRQFERWAFKRGVAAGDSAATLNATRAISSRA